MASGKKVKSDKIGLMKVGQVRNLLNNNGININGKKGTARGLRLLESGKFLSTTQAPIECTAVSVFAADTENYTTYNYQYDEFVSRLHLSAASEGQAGAGVPLIFNPSTSHRIQHATRQDTRRVREHKSYSVILPKARVAFKRENISPTKDFVEAVEKALKDKDPAEKLLDYAFKDYGEFFATDITLGGRLIFLHDAQLDQSYTEETNQSQFQLACQALIPTEVGPVKGVGDWGAGLSQDKKDTVNRQKAFIKLEMKGGSHTQTEPKTWGPTVAKYMNPHSADDVLI